MTIRVRNNHKAPVAGISPGLVGDVDETNPGTKAYLGAGHLVPVASDAPVTAGPAYDALNAARSEMKTRSLATLKALEDSNGAEFTRRDFAELIERLSSRGDVEDLRAKLAAKDAEIELLKGGSADSAKPARGR